VKERPLYLVKETLNFESGEGAAASPPTKP
jgi:hypothetical protein